MQKRHIEKSDRLARMFELMRQSDRAERAIAFGRVPKNVELPKEVLENIRTAAAHSLQASADRRRWILF